MPGTYEHIIEYNADFEVPTITIKAPFEEIQSEIESDLADLKTQMIANKSRILTEIEHESQLLQRETLQGYDSNKTGTLSKSINIRRDGNTSHIGTDLFYAQYVNDGRGDVYPIRAKYLHFWYKGNEIFTKHSRPAKPRPYLDNSADELDGKIDEIVNNYLEMVI